MMSTPLTYLNDLWLDATNSDIMHVRVGLDNCSVAKAIEFPVSLSYMGLDWDDDFGFEFSRDLQRDMNTFYAANHRLPSAEEYRVLTEQHRYS